MDTPAFGKILILNGHVLFSDADDFVYNEMTVHVPMAVHPNPQESIGYWGGDGGVAQVLTLVSRTWNKSISLNQMKCWLRFVVNISQILLRD